MELVLSSAPLLVLGSILVSVQFISSYYKQIRSNRSFIWPESLGIQPWIILLCYTDHWGKNWTNQGNKLHGHSEVWAFEGRLPLLFSGMCCGKFLCSVCGEGAGVGLASDAEFQRPEVFVKIPSMMWRCQTASLAAFFKDVLSIAKESEIKICWSTATDKVSKQTEKQH